MPSLTPIYTGRINLGMTREKNPNSPTRSQIMAVQSLASTFTAIPKHHSVQWMSDNTPWSDTDTFNTHRKNDNRTWLITQQIFFYYYYYYFQVTFFSSISINAVETEDENFIHIVTHYSHTLSKNNMYCQPNLRADQQNILSQKLNHPTHLNLAPLRVPSLLFCHQWSVFLHPY